MTTIDTRPAHCRFRLQDEGMSYPRSSCTHCGKTITSGLGTGCALGHVANAAPSVVSGAKLVAGVPDAWGRVVSMVEHKGTIYVATERVVCRIVDDELVPLRFTIPEYD